MKNYKLIAIFIAVLIVSTQSFGKVFAAEINSRQESVPSPTLLKFHSYLPIVKKDPMPTYYVSTTGNDANPGTIAQPWRTIAKAANTLVAGEAVKILPGTYFEKFEPAQSGNANGYITYTADPGTVILDGTGVALSTSYLGDGLVQILGKSYIKVENLGLRNASVHCVNISADSADVRATYIEITGLHIQNCNLKGINARYSDHININDNVIDHINYSSGIGVWYSTNAIVDHNTITNAHYYHECQGAYDEVLTISGVNHFEVKNNTLDTTEPYPPGFCDLAEKLGIDVKESSQNGKVYRNTVRNMNAAGIYVDGWMAGSNDRPTLNHIDVFQNLVIDGGGILVGCEQSVGVVEYINIYNNLVINAAFSGIHVTGSHGNGLRKNIVIENNTIYGASPLNVNGGAGIYITTSNLGSNNEDAPVIIRNNISMYYVLATGGGYVGQIRAGDSTMASMVTADHNLVYGRQSCSQAFPNCVELGSRITASPTATFANPDSFDLHLNPGSPAIDAGITSSLVLMDIDNLPRPQGNSYDIGAYEFRFLLFFPLTNRAE
jgi:parallel beta-helix repeat protein